METEKIFTGYCCRTDQARIVEAVFEGHTLQEADCMYEKCEFRDRCTIGKSITECLSSEE